VCCAIRHGAAWWWRAKSRTHRTAGRWNYPNAHDAVHRPSLLNWWLLEQLSQKDLQNPRIRKLRFVKIGFYDRDESCDDRGNQ